MRACGRTSTKPIACSRASWCWRARSADSWARRRRCRWRTSSATRSPDSARRSPPSRSSFDSSLAPACVEGSETLLDEDGRQPARQRCETQPAAGSVTVSCEADRETARLVVESDGSVLDQEAVGQLAQPFRRLGTERTGSPERPRSRALDRRCGRRCARRRAHALRPRARRSRSRDHAAGRSRSRHDHFGMRVSSRRGRAAAGELDRRGAAATRESPSTSPTTATRL